MSLTKTYENKKFQFQVDFNWTKDESFVEIRRERVSGPPGVLPSSFLERDLHFSMSKSRFHGTNG